MAGPNESNLYLKQAVAKLVEGIEGLTDNDGDLIVQTGQLFDIPYPTADTWVCVNPRNMTMTEVPDGFPAVIQTWNVPIKLCIGNLGAEYGGNQQGKIWERLPTVINFIETHPHLQFAGNTDLTPFLDTTKGVSIQPGSMLTSTENLETGDLLISNFVVAFPFRLQRITIKYQDGQLVEVY
jgi:hypothetical protein